MSWCWKDARKDESQPISRKNGELLHLRRFVSWLKSVKLCVKERALKFSIRQAWNFETVVMKINLLRLIFLIMKLLLIQRLLSLA